MTNKEIKNQKNYWFDRMINQWKKESKYEFWKNLTPLQRKYLTNDLKNYFESCYMMGRESVLQQIEHIVKNIKL